MRKLRSLWAIILTVALLFTVAFIPTGALADSREIIYFSHTNPLYPNATINPPLYSSPAQLADADEYHSLEGAGALMRDQMELRSPTIVVGYVVNGTSITSEQLQQYATEIFDEATKHTGEPTEGDYLLWHYAGYGGSISRYTENGKTYITYTFNVSYYTTFQQEQQLTNAVNSLLSSLNVWSTSDYNKVCAIYDYICETISYDTAGLNSGDNLVYTAYAALIKKKAVCQGYASLFYRLALSVGVDARLIAGYGAGGRHGWNIVKLSGKYYNLDATWDAGASQYDYFLRAEANFGDHLRFDEYNTSAFHAAHPMSLSDYDPNQDTPTPPSDDNGGYCGNGVKWQLDQNGSLKIKGNGAVLAAPWKDKTVRSVTIEEGVTALCTGAFQNNSLLTSVSLPSTLQTIGDYAFAGCRGLVYVNIPDGTNIIGKGAFSGCSLLQTVQFSDTVIGIYEEAFADCERLANIVLPKYISVIYDDTFKNCSSLESITIGKYVTVIGVNAFGGCDNLTDIYYKGTANEWAKISVNSGNNAISYATVHYAPKDGWQNISGKWYYYKDGDPVKNAWKKDTKGWCYLGSDGAMKTNAWVRDSVGWCYVGADGYAVTNQWKKDSYGWCYLNSQGSMTKNAWVLDGGKWYYLNASGYMVTNVWKKDTKGWCYLGSSGAMATNAWVRDSIGWCYVGADGYAVTNQWKKDSHGWCYLNSQGSMVKNNWVLDGGKWYYLDQNGYMVYNTTRYIGGKYYRFNASGVLIG